MIFLAAGIRGIYRLFRPKTWWGRLSEDLIEWGTNNKATKSYSSEAVETIEVNDDHEFSSITIQLVDGTSIKISNPEVFFGFGLQEFQQALAK